MISIISWVFWTELARGGEGGKEKLFGKGKGEGKREENKRIHFDLFCLL
jgi:hypothetical protein